MAEITDGAYGWALERLRKEGGPLWKDALCQADIVRYTVDETRRWDTRRRKESKQTWTRSTSP